MKSSESAGLAVPRRWQRILCGLCGLQALEIYGGEGGIRTLGRGLGPYDGLANRCFRPLSHLSVDRVQQDRTTGETKMLTP